MVALEFRRGLESLPYVRGDAKDMSILEGCLLCFGVRGDVGILIYSRGDLQMFAQPHNNVLHEVPFSVLQKLCISVSSSLLLLEIKQLMTSEVRQ